jgi:HlyD family secretion protein
VSRRRIVWAAVVLVVLFSIGMISAARRTHVASEEGDIPVAPVKRGDLDTKIYTTGELRASHSTMLSAPPIGGGVLQITHLLRTGTPVKKDDVVIEFDPAEQQYKLEQSRSELLQAEQEITKAKADAAVRAAQDKVALLKARFDVRRAELEVGKNELVSAIDAKKNELALDQSKRALAQLEQDIQSHTASGNATIALAEEKRNKARLAMDQAQQNIQKMRVRSPMNGLVAIEKNLDSAGGMSWGGMSLPDYREGDQTQPGSTVAQVIDPTEMEVAAKINERDRSNIKIGQDTDIQLDALPGYSFHGTVKTVSGMATKSNFWEDQSGGKFDITIQIPGADPSLRAGFTAQLFIVGDVRKNVLYVPRQALFIKDGKRVAYVKTAAGFEPREVQVKSENESRAAIEGLKPEAEVALVNPLAPRKVARTSTAEPMGGGTR